MNPGTATITRSVGVALPGIEPGEPGVRFEAVLPAVPGIYSITDTSSGRFYIGSSANIQKRWIHHRYRFGKNTHPNPILQAIWSTDPSRLVIRVVENVPLSELLAVEQWYLNESKVGSNRMCMNILTVAGSHLGRKRSEITKARIAVAKTGLSHGPEAKAKMRAAKIGKPLSAEHRAKIGERSKGKPGPTHTPEMIAKWRRYSVDQVSELRRLVAGGKDVSNSARAVGMSRDAARRVLAGESYIGVGVTTETANAT